MDIFTKVKIWHRVLIFVGGLLLTGVIVFYFVVGALGAFAAILAAMIVSVMYYVPIIIVQCFIYYILKKTGRLGFAYLVFFFVFLPILIAVAFILIYPGAISPLEVTIVSTSIYFGLVVIRLQNIVNKGEVSKDQRDV